MPVRLVREQITRTGSGLFVLGRNVNGTGNQHIPKSTNSHFPRTICSAPATSEGRHEKGMLQPHIRFVLATQNDLPTPYPHPIPVILSPILLLLAYTHFPLERSRNEPPPTYSHLYMQPEGVLHAVGIPPVQYSKREDCTP